MKSRRTAIITIILSLLVLLTGISQAAPILGKEYTLRQPDGTKVQVKIWGDEFYQRVESLDGYTLLRNSENWICYAELSENENSFEATEIVYTGIDIEKDEALKMQVITQSGIEKGLSLNKEARSQISQESRERWNFDRVLYPSFTSTSGSSSGLETPAPPLGTETLLGDVIGLVICVEFPDETGTITTQQVDDYCNLIGYTEFGNNGSVRDYYYDVSGGNLNYTNIVTGYYTAQNNKSYYDDPTRDAGDAGRELLSEALSWLEGQNFDFTQLSVDGSNTMLGINLFYAGQVESGWTMGLWPHSGYFSGFTSSSGISSGRYQITDMGSSLEIGTFCHENGHMICHWPDLYDYGYESTGVGMFCLMAYGNADGRNPIPANAYFRDIKGWESVVEMGPDNGPAYIHQSNTASSFRYSNPSNPVEFFYIESRRQTGRNLSLPDEGLVIWHVDETGDNDYEQMTPSQHYIVSLEQADGRFDLENGTNSGDTGDLFSASGVNIFNDATIPGATWWDGTDSGLDITVTSNPGGDTMTFETFDMSPPVPNPMTWEIEPIAVGSHTIFAKITVAQDKAGVEYYIDCETNPDAFNETYGDTTFDSGWVTDTLYYHGGFTEDQTYYFRVKARDLTEYYNETEWSEIFSATPGADAQMYPEPAEWESAPRRLFGNLVGMTVALGYSEIDATLEYEIQCTETTDPAGVAAFHKSYSISRNHSFTGQTGMVYKFKCRYRDSLGHESGWSDVAQVKLNPPPRILEVPNAYTSIQAAINAAQGDRGDTILVHPGTYYERNLNLNAPFATLPAGSTGSDMEIIIRCENPEDPAVVAATIINCGGTLSGGGSGPARAFIFGNGEGRNVRIEGFTIRNAFAVNSPTDPAQVTAGTGAVNGHDAFGGAILCGVLDSNNNLAGTQRSASPTIRKCTFQNCYAKGQIGAAGGYENGPDAAPGANGLNGDNAGDGGWAKGGAIYCVAGSAPLIEECRFTGCYAIGGDGGTGGQGQNGGPEDNTVEPALPAGIGGNGGNGGNGASAYGGAFYFEQNCKPEILDVEISNTFAEIGQPGAGGNGGDGGLDEQGTNVVGAGGNGGSVGGLVNTVTYANNTDFGAGAGAIYYSTGCQPRIETLSITNAYTNASITTLTAGLGGQIGGQDGSSIPGANVGQQSAYAGANYYGPNCSPFVDSTLTQIPIRDMIIQNCQTDSDKGGAEYYETNCVILLEDCDYRNNTCTTSANGGTIYLYDPNSMTFTRCSITNSTAYRGGGIYFEGLSSATNLRNTLSFIDCIFSGNNSNVNYQGSFGGAVYLGNLAKAQMLSATLPYYASFQGCEFDTNSSPYGGAICADAVLLDVIDCTFEENEAQYGAAIYLNASDAFVNTSKYYSNSANSLGNPIEFCSAGAIHCLNSTFLLMNSHFAGNESSSYAGAILVEGPGLNLTYDEQLITNCLFNDNTAVFGGGAISTSVYSLVTIESCTITENSLSGSYAAGAGLDCYGGSTKLVNSILWGNSATLGAQISVGDPLELTNPSSLVLLDHCDIQRGLTGIFRGTPTGNSVVWDEGGNINSNPLLRDITDATDPSSRRFYLSQVAAGQLNDSPCLNAGNGTASSLNLKIGYQGTTSTSHDADQDTVDMGYHYDASLPTSNYQLTTMVYVADYYPYGQLDVTIDPITPRVEINPDISYYIYTFKQGTEVSLVATPKDENYRVAQWYGTDNDMTVIENNIVTMSSNKTAMVEFELAVSKKLYVPETYATIEQAIQMAREHDTIVLAPRPDAPYTIDDQDGINFEGKDLVIQSVDPDDPLVVAQTIIDCQGNQYLSKRAFHFESGETNNSIIEGITIRNAFTAVIGDSAAIPTGRWPWWDGVDPDPWTVDPPSPDPLPPFRAWSGEDATGDSYGGAILIEKGSSPIIRKCVFENCTVSGGVGGDGEDGMYPANYDAGDQDLDSQSGGHSGKGTGNGYGGAIAIRSGSNPQIRECTFINNRATGGWGGIPGDAGNSYNSGRYGWGGNDIYGLQYAYTYYGISFDAGCGEGDGRGGALFVAAGCSPDIISCKFEGNYARPGYVYEGGASADGANYPEPFDPDNLGDPDLRPGMDGYLTSYGYISGGAIFFEENADVMINGCEFVQNEAYRVSGPSDSPVTTRGGAVYSDPDATVVIKDSVFEKNVAGALYCSTGVALSVERTQFIDNTSYYPQEDQSGLELLLGSVTESEILGGYNVAGALTLEIDAASANLDWCEFLGNASHVEGGAVRTASNLEFTNCILNGNRSESDGGAFYGYSNVDFPNIHTIEMSFLSCELSGNEAMGLGGAGFIKNCILTMDDTFLVQNKAFSGGALRVSQSEVITINNSLIWDNEATGLISGTHRTVTQEGFGGGIHISDTPFLIQNTRFIENTASGIIASGGAVCVTGSQSYYEQKLQNCLFARNDSDNVGGAVSGVVYADLEIDNCTFADNNNSEDNPSIKGAALYLDQQSQAAIKNSIVSSNKGIALYAKTGGIIDDVQYTLFYNNSEADFYKNGVQSSAIAENGNLIADPVFVHEGALGDYYLNQTLSPAVNAGSRMANDQELDLHEFTTHSVDTNPILDQGIVDLGYHYPDPTNILKYTLERSVVDEDGEIMTDAGTIMPDNGLYLRGKVVDLTAVINKEYYLTGWAGGTFNDQSLDYTNKVLMSDDKYIKVILRLRQTLNVGTSMEYDTLGDAIVAAQDGDTIIVAPGEYTSASQHASIANFILLDGKKITISGSNPENEAAVRATIFRDYDFILNNLSNETVIEGITLNQSQMNLTQADIILRNCIFDECRFFRSQLVHAGQVPAGTDGYSQLPIIGGALAMWDSKPLIINCSFENNSATGADGEDGYAGAQSHPTGGDGGWPGGAYGGAVYCGLSSEPNFINCTFVGNETFGGNGGNGANGWNNNGTIYNGGRGGGWLYSEDVEQYLIEYGLLVATDYWDGWVNNAYGHKYGYYSWYADYYGEYDLEVWARWFNWGDTYSSWDQFLADYNNDNVDPLGDPYDQMLDVWRYSGYGGAVFCELDSDATFIGCVFENNQAHGGLTGIGGHIEGETSRPDRQLNMPNAGGAVFAALDCDLVFEKCQFRGNIADTSHVDLPHSFQTSFGGAVAYQYDCSAVFTDCEFSGNDATVGGAIYSTESIETIMDASTVENNTAYLGGGIYLEHDTATITDSTIQGNEASQTIGTESVETGHGGGIYAGSVDLELRDTVFVNNRAGLVGGGLLLSGTVSDAAEVFNCLFVYNTARSAGGGASASMYSRASFGNCTFADNKITGIDLSFDSGGGLFVASESAVDVIDSIFWANEAGQGYQIAVGADEENFPGPASLDISYSIIQGYPSSDAIYRGEDTDIKTGNIYKNDPEFVELPDIEEDDYVNQYYLDQGISPALNKGSDTAYQLGLGSYTTSMTGAFDLGIVDLGYHYKKVAIDVDYCGFADLVLSGRIDLLDWTVLADAWLEQDEMNRCGDDNNWCNGADLNFDTLVNAQDMMRIANCWLIEDKEAPSPNPSEWVIDPNALYDEFGIIEMAAVLSHDKWWPDDRILYKFESAQYPDITPDQDKIANGGNNDGWIALGELGSRSKDSEGNVVRIYVTFSGLEPVTYDFTVKAMDGYGKETAFSNVRYVKPGSNLTMPQAEWWYDAVNPDTINGLPVTAVQNGEVVVVMRARALADFDDLPFSLPDGYTVKYSFVKDGAVAATVNTPTWVDKNVATGETHTYSVVMEIYYLEDTKVTENDEDDTLFAEPYTMVVQNPDVTAPTPDPAEHASGYPIIFGPIVNLYYHVVVAVEATDDGDGAIAGSNVEYRFTCWDGDSLVHVSGWRNVDSVAGTFYPNNTVQVPYQYWYWAKTGHQESDYQWIIECRDRSPQNNECQESEAHSADDPAP